MKYTAVGKVIVRLLMMVLVFLLLFNLIPDRVTADEQVLRMLKLFCQKEPIKESRRFVCPICPEFTDFAGEDYDRFIVTEVIGGNFIPGVEVKYVGYFGCEPRIRFYGGYVILLKDKDRTERVLVDEEREYLGRCRKIKGRDRDLLECRGGDAYQGRPRSWRVLCEFKGDGGLTCNKGRKNAY